LLAERRGRSKSFVISLVPELHPCLPVEASGTLARCECKNEIVLCTHFLYRVVRSCRQDRRWQVLAWSWRSDNNVSHRVNFKIRGYENYFKLNVDVSGTPQNPPLKNLKKK
jgi:hypothetical protein